ncbi:MAG: rhodanese-like domain-containing protein [Candidatus Rokubacteria bacterium]|nr:rhodanese-like domain-containing protein [Candidatus Rokubacteria bacterium]MBI3827384.1 rhodanese-like domain-containing protein [Candidatus Rokubacteria bacterium]
MRRTLIPVLAAAGVLLGAAPAAPPESPVAFIKVAELHAALAAGTKADIIDVRHWAEYAELHIKGARSMPLRAVPERAGEITKTGLAVFY